MSKPDIHLNNNNILEINYNRSNLIKLPPVKRLWGDNIITITCVAGENGTGKSTFLREIHKEIEKAARFNRANVFLISNALDSTFSYLSNNPSTNTIYTPENLLNQSTNSYSKNYIYQYKLKEHIYNFNLIVNENINSNFISIPNSFTFYFSFDINSFGYLYKNINKILWSIWSKKLSNLDLNSKLQLGVIYHKVMELYQKIMT